MASGEGGSRSLAGVRFKSAAGNRPACRGSLEGATHGRGWPRKIEMSACPSEQAACLPLLGMCDLVALADDSRLADAREKSFAWRNDPERLEQAAPSRDAAHARANGVSGAMARSVRAGQWSIGQRPRPWGQGQRPMAICARRATEPPDDSRSWAKRFSGRRRLSSLQGAVAGGLF